MSCYLNWNLDCYRLVLSYEEEVCVKSFVGYRVILYLVKYCITASAVVELEVDDVRVRSVSDSLEILCVDGEKDVLHSESIDVAWNKSCSAYSLYCCLVAGLAYLAVEFNVLHCCKRIKMCYSVSAQDGNPIAPKSVSAFYGAAKIYKIFETQIVFVKKILCFAPDDGLAYKSCGLVPFQRLVILVKFSVSVAWQIHA